MNIIDLIALTEGMPLRHPVLGGEHNKYPNICPGAMLRAWVTHYRNGHLTGSLI
jgi:hypothetical protein